MKTARRIIISMFLIVVVLSLVACDNNSEEQSFKFEYWNESEALTTLTTYVTAVTDEKAEAQYNP